MIEKINETNKKVDSLSDKLDKHIANNELTEILNIRIRILAFADDVRNGINHSKERYDQMLNEITQYNNYCIAHPDFPNAAAIHAISFIETEYDLRLNNTKQFLM